MDDSGQRESRRQRTGSHAMWNGIREQNQNVLLMSTKINMLLAERDAAMEERDRALSEKRAAIAERDAAIQQRDDALSAREIALRERDNALAALRFQESAINDAFGYIPVPEMKPFVQSCSRPSPKYKRGRRDSKDPHIAETIPLEVAPPKPARLFEQRKRKAASNAPLSKPRKSAKKEFNVGEDLNKHITKDGTKAASIASLSRPRKFKVGEDGNEHIAKDGTKVVSNASLSRPRKSAKKVFKVGEDVNEHITEDGTKAASIASLSRPRKSTEKEFKVGEDLNERITKDGTKTASNDSLSKPRNSTRKELKLSDILNKHITKDETKAASNASLFKPRASTKIEYKVVEDLSKLITKDVTHAEWESQDLSSIKEVKFDKTLIPSPVCTCTGTARQCYKWGSGGGWQSACCTESISAYPLPLAKLKPKRRQAQARVAGRKMTSSVFGRLLTKVAAAGHDLSVPIDLKNFWSKHGTNKWILIK